MTIITDGAGIQWDVDGTGRGRRITPEPSRPQVPVRQKVRQFGKPKALGPLDISAFTPRDFEGIRRILIGSLLADPPFRKGEAIKELRERYPQATQEEVRDAVLAWRRVYHERFAHEGWSNP